MNKPISLNSAEQNAFRITFADGLWDVFIGAVLLEFAIAPLLSGSLGDFWSSVVFLPFWGLLYLLLRSVRKNIIKPRLGSVNFSAARKKKIRTFTVIMMSISLIIFILGLVAAFTFGRASNIFLAGLFGLFILAGFSAAAYLLDYSRLYIYGLLLLSAPLVGEWLFQNQRVAHHGYPLVFGFASGLLIFSGIATFIIFLIKSSKSRFTGRCLN